jgi:hypothetical protein
MENDEVTFDLEEGEKGLNAVNVKLSQDKKTPIIFKSRQWRDFFCSIHRY